jgi:hypothetical protein
LIHATSVSEEAEATMISQLKVRNSWN